jgi:hypothetical protein
MDLLEKPYVRDFIKQMREMGCTDQEISEAIRKSIMDALDEFPELRDELPSNIYVRVVGDEVEGIYALTGPQADV